MLLIVVIVFSAIVVCLQAEIDLLNKTISILQDKELDELSDLIDKLNKLN